MGSGKGNPEFWVAVVRPGRVLFELSGVAPDVAREALRRAAAKAADRHEDRLARGGLSMKKSELDELARR